MKMGDLKTMFVLALGLLLAAGSALGVPAVRAESVSVDTISISGGNVLTVRGTGFRRNEDVATWASYSRGGAVFTGKAKADGTGAVVLNVLVRRAWGAGWWAITMRGLRSEREAAASFEVLPGAPNGELDVSPTVAGRGAVVGFHGVGFVGDEPVSFWVTRPDGSVTGFESSPRSTAAGDVWFTLTLPADAQSGRWMMSAYGAGNDRLLVGAFTIAP